MVQEILIDIKDLVVKLFDSPASKIVGAFLIGIVQHLFGPHLLPVHTAIIILIACDWIFGLAYAVCRREVSSEKSMRGVLKLTLYGGVFIVSAQLAKVDIVGPLLGGGLAGVVVVTEAVSVLENIDRLAQWKRIDLPFLQPLVRFLKQRQAEYIQRGERSE